MKTLYFILITAFIFLTLGCKENTTPDVTPDYSLLKEVKSDNHELHRNFIDEHFKGNVLARTDYYEIAEALDLMNEGLNSLYCRPGQKLFDSTFTYFDTIPVDVNGSEEIYKEDLASAMDAFAEFAGEIFYSRDVDDTIKVSWAFNVTQVAAPSGGEVDLGVMYIMQEGEPRDEEDSFPYEESWPWFYDEEEDEAPACASPTISNGSEDLFRRDLRSAVTFLWTGPDPVHYYINLQFVTFVGSNGSEVPFLDEDLIYTEYNLEDLINEEDGQEEDNYFDYLLWHNASDLPNNHDCLTVNEMNFHYQAMRDLLLDNLPPNTDVITNVEVGYFSFAVGHTVKFHLMQGWYGDIVELEIGKEEPESLPFP